MTPVIELPPAGDPAHYAVSSDDAELGRVWFSALSGIVDRFRHQLVVFRVHITIKIFPAPDVRIRRNAKHVLQVPKPGQPSGFQVQSHATDLPASTARRR